MTDTVEVSTHIEAPVATVFSFFADPSRFSTWFEHGSSITPGVGGRVEIRSPMGPPASGRIDVWDIDRRIVFRFGHPAGSGPLAPESSTVTVTFVAERGGTRVTIRHTGIPDEPLRKEAMGGWRAGLGRLAGSYWRERAGSRLSALVEGWIAAWREPDLARRRGLLADCCHPDVEFRDQFARIDGVDALTDWIGGVQMMMPGFRIEPTGGPELVQGHLSWPWRIVGPDGTVAGHGHQYARLDQDLRIAVSVGFWSAAR